MRLDRFMERILFSLDATQEKIHTFNTFSSNMRLDRFMERILFSLDAKQEKIQGLI